MAFWSSEQFRDRMRDEPLIEGFDENALRHGAYELAVGPEALVSATIQEQRQTIEPRGKITIPPGQFGMLLTEEIVQIPLNAIGFISIRASIKFYGLINVSGFHVDPGFRGRLKFAVYNAGSSPITVSRGDRIFMLWLCDLDRSTADGYGGQRPGQNIITSKDVMRMQGEVASPSQLKADIEQLRASVGTLRWLFGVLVTVVLAGLLTFWFQGSPSIRITNELPNAGDRSHEQEARPPAATPPTTPPSSPVKPPALPLKPEAAPPGSRQGSTPRQQ